jgi:hypothetical protein
MADQTMTADALEKLLDAEAEEDQKGRKIVPPPSLASTAAQLPAQPPAQDPAAPVAKPAAQPAQPPARPPVQVVDIPRKFGPPDRVPTVEEILGHPVGRPVKEEQPPESLKPNDGKSTRDPLSDEREKKDAKEKTSSKEAADIALRNLLKEYPSTKLVNVRVFWRNPRSGEYRYKGSRKNVDVNEVRRPDNIVAPYGRDWIISFQAVEARWDDPKSWQSFQFTRDGPDPSDDWTIDAPPQDGLFVEVEGMGQISVNDLKELITATTSNTLDQKLKQMFGGPQGGGGNGGGFQGGGGGGFQGGGFQGFTGYQQPYQYPPQYMQPPPPPPPVPVVPPPPDPRVEERERETRERIKSLEDSNRALIERLQASERTANDRVQEAEKARMDAMHRAEVDALKSGFQSAMESTKSTMEALNNKLAVIEAKANQPPPPPPPPPPPQQTGMDFATAIVTVAPHLKEIFTASRNADAETAKIKEQSLAAERQREQEERARERDREREERDRDRDRRRDETEKAREEIRERREATEREQTRMRDEAQRTLDMYRSLGEQAANNARMISDIVTKQNDPAGTMSVIKMATDSMTQQMQLFAALAKNGLFGGGPAGAPGVDWGAFAQNALQMFGNIGASWAESKAKASATAASVAARVISPPSPALGGMQSHAPLPQHVPQQQPQQPPSQQQPPPQGQPQQPPATTEVNPLAAFVQGVNQAIEAKETPERVAGKIAGIVHIAQEFGELKKNKVLQKLMEDPEQFLRKAYPTADQAYLTKIAEILLETFPNEEDNEEDDDDTNEGTRTEEAAGAAEEASVPPPPQQQQQQQTAAPSPEHQPVPEGHNGGGTPPVPPAPAPKRRGRPPKVIQPATTAPTGPVAVLPPAPPVSPPLPPVQTPLPPEPDSTVVV